MGRWGEYFQELLGEDENVNEQIKQKTSDDDDEPIDRGELEEA